MRQLKCALVRLAQEYLACSDGGNGAGGKGEARGAEEMVGRGMCACLLAAYIDDVDMGEEVPVAEAERLVGSVLRMVAASGYADTRADAPSCTNFALSLWPCVLSILQRTLYGGGRAGSGKAGLWGEDVLRVVPASHVTGDLFPHVFAPLMCLL